MLISKALSRSAIAALMRIANSSVNAISGIRYQNVTGAKLTTFTDSISISGIAIQRWLNRAAKSFIASHVLYAGLGIGGS